MTSSALVLSPHSRRCSPSSHRSPRARHRVGRRLGDDVLAGQTVAVVERGQQPVQVLALEAGERQVEAGGVERLQLGRQQLVVPAGQLGQPVVGDAVGAHLLRRQVRQADHRHRIEPEMPRRQQPAVAGDDLVVVRHHHRRRPAVLDQRGGDPGDLIVRVRPRVAGIRLQPRDRPLLDLLGQEWEHRRCVRKGEVKGRLVWSAGAGGRRPGFRLDFVLASWTPSGSRTPEFTWKPPWSPG